MEHGIEVWRQTEECSTELDSVVVYYVVVGEEVEACTLVPVVSCD